MTSLLSDTGHKIFSRHKQSDGHIPVSARNQAAHWPAELWQAISEAGLPAALASEDSGGFGFSPTEVVGLLPLAAQYSVPVPLAETVMANWLFGLAGLPLTGQPCGLIFLPAESAMPAQRIAFGRHLRCAAIMLPDTGSDSRIYRIDELSLIEPSHNLAGEARDTLAFDLSELQPLSLPLPMEQLYAHAALLRAAAISGALNAVLQRTLDYANERQQFGRPIGKFQSIQHYLATMASEAAAARMAVTGAAERWGEPSFALYAAAAKVRAGEAAGVMASHAHQIHGAMGFSWEYALQYHTRRLWAWREEYGSESYWSDWIGQHVVSAGPDGLWPLLTETHR